MIVLDDERRVAERGDKVSLEGHDVIVVQTKVDRLGMYLLGQALFSRELIANVGRAIHPSYVEGQMQCGVAQGIGWALNEE